MLLLTVDPQKVISGKAEVVDLKTGTATTVASPGNIGQSRLDLLPDGRIWLTQQEDGHALIYDPSANRWTATSNAPLGAEIQTVTAVPGHRMLVTASPKVMVFDPASGGWSDAGSLPGAWSQYSATARTTQDRGSRHQHYRNYESRPNTQKPPAPYAAAFVPCACVWSSAGKLLR